jgi:tetratricopeptide (TPR) repeat protein
MVAAYARLPEYREAIEFQERALEILRRLGDIEDDAADLDLMGLLYMFLGDYRKAALFHELALEEDRLIGGVRPEGGPLCSAGYVRAMQFDHYYRAIDLYKRALQGLRRVTKLVGDTISAVNIGPAFGQQRSYEEGD